MQAQRISQWGDNVISSLSLLSLLDSFGEKVKPGPEVEILLPLLIQNNMFAGAGILQWGWPRRAQIRRSKNTDTKMRSELYRDL